MYSLKAGENCKPKHPRKTSQILRGAYATIAIIVLPFGAFRQINMNIIKSWKSLSSCSSPTYFLSALISLPSAQIILFIPYLFSFLICVICEICVFIFYLIVDNSQFSLFNISSIICYHKKVNSAAALFTCGIFSVPLKTAKGIFFQFNY